MPQPTKSGKIEKKKKITDYTVKNQDKPEVSRNSLSTKRTSSALSPSDNPQQAKKANMSQVEKVQEMAEGKGEELKEVIGPLIAEVTQPLLTELKLLRESVDTRYSTLEEAITSQHQEVTEEIHRLESLLSTQKDLANADLLQKINSNQELIDSVLKRNTSLEKENMVLKERLDKI